MIAAHADGNIHAYKLEEMLQPSSITTACDGGNYSLIPLAQYLTGCELVNPGGVQPLPAGKRHRLCKELKRELASDGD